MPNLTQLYSLTYLPNHLKVERGKVLIFFKNALMSDRLVI